MAHSLFILTHNNLSFNSRHFLQVQRMNMGTQDLLNKPLPSLSPSENPPNLRKLTVDMSLCPHWPATSTGSQPCNRTRCKTCPIHHPANSCTNLTYPITTHADCKSKNLIYQLGCECNAFYIGETHHSLSDHMNGHRFTTIYQTQTYQLLSTHNPTRSLSKNASLSVSYTIYLTPSQATFTTNLKVQTNLSRQPPVSTSINSSTFHSCPNGTYSLSQSLLFYCWGRPQCFGWKSKPIFVSFLYILATLTRMLDNA